MNTGSNNYTQIESDTATPNGASEGRTTGNANVLDNFTWAQKLKESSHPIALVFYIFFRLGPIFLYIFGSFIIGFVTEKNRFILHFILIVLLVCADFWNIKNISGRLLVGLRWWNEIATEGANGEYENVWVFETADPDRYINPIDSKVFWILLYVQPVIWGLLGILALFKLEFLYLILIIISISLSVTNGLAYTRCDKFRKANGLASDLVSRTTNSLLSRLNPFSS
ncbi:Piso0_002814 [Millerozyma farinosa CBS 7064]|uniref:Golgi apparatus membrane protein TVP23 n=1 Tax=Pichia sorbitophila (strain ATCC MYA-4447 / BCRC 22081 / CBS 7064 / NBRC 10061 / NRRL Y-12695) TaxID=559304 RepID=G8YG18_PICSO|nr:Piso0_002814 [Millerozyma farinosa CBS 7064]